MPAPTRKAPTKVIASDVPTQAQLERPKYALGQWPALFLPLAPRCANGAFGTFCQTIGALSQSIKPLLFDDVCITDELLPWTAPTEEGSENGNRTLGDSNWRRHYYNHHIRRSGLSGEVREGASRA